LADNESTRAMRAAARAKDAPGGLLPGEYCRTTGVVRDPTPIAVDNQLAAFALGTDEEHVPGSDPNIVVKSFGNVGPFFVETGRTLVEVDPRGVLWSGPEKRQWRGFAPSGNKQTITAEYLPVGVPVVLVGRAEAPLRGGPAQLAATSADPVVLVRADGPGGS